MLIAGGRSTGDMESTSSPSPHGIWWESRRYITKICGHCPRYDSRIPTLLFLATDGGGAAPASQLSAHTPAPVIMTSLSSDF